MESSRVALGCTIRVGDHPFFWGAVLIVATSCGGKRTGFDSDGETCEEWFNREYGFDQVEHYRCSASKADCSLSDLDFSVAVGAAAPAGSEDNGSPQRELSISAVVANSTDSDLTYSPTSGCFVDRVIVRGSDSGTNISGECGEGGRSWDVPGGTKTELAVMGIGREEFGEGRLRVLMQFSPEEATCCVCSTWP